MKKALFIALLFVFGRAFGQDVYKPYEEIVKKMTLEEKIALLHADGKFCTGAVPRLGIPEIWMSDGPHGVREEISRHNWNPAGWTTDSSTYLPTLTTLASTWNPTLAYLHGQTLGNEAKARNKHIILGPGINIHRSPLCGRNFEYMSEDPYLISQLVVPYIKGVQSEDVAACVKHYALNNQEYLRGIVNAEVDERTLREIYLPGFEAAVKEAGVLTVMGAYNRVRGQYACQNNYLLNRILREEWGFKGIVISDWAAVHNTYEAANNGLDIEMGTDGEYKNNYFADPLIKLVKNKEVTEEVIDEKVKRILYVIHQTFMYKKSTPGKFGDPSHAQAAKEIASEAAVLLKNSPAGLPLDVKKVKTIAVIGDNATRKQSYGGWSSEIKAKYEIVPLVGLQKQVPKNVKVVFAQGYNMQKKGSDTLDRKLFDEAVKIAKKADVVLFFGGLNHNLDAEGWDKPDMKLPYHQEQLISELVAANPKTIVVMVCGSPVEMGNWTEKVPAILQTSFNGMEGGNALAEIILGKINPSGKLPTTYPVKLEDSPAHKLGEFPGKNGNARYNEGLLVGYRYFDTEKVEPRFCFGYGLSYTTFEYKNLKVPSKVNAGNDKIEISLDVTNTGKVEGKEVVQLYVRDEVASVMRPEKELKAFGKVSLKPGETKTVKLMLNQRALQFYDANKAAWVAEPGMFEVLIGSSSRDIRLKGQFELN
jgi:beta-glucosidase